MSHNNRNYRRHRLKLRILFGMFEADATGTAAIGATLFALVLVGAGRWYGSW